MSFNEGLQRLRDAKKLCLFEAQSIENERDTVLEQIEEERKSAILRYAELRKAKYQELREHNSEIDKYCGWIEYYSYFDINIIGKAIASLIRTFEGTNYIYQEAEYHTTEMDTLASETQRIRVIKHPRIVVSEDSMHDSYYDYKGETLNSLLKNGLAVVLADDETMSEIPFYCANTSTHTLEQRVKFGRFSYVKDFIDELISYKMALGQKDISAGEIERLKIEFISHRVEQIQQNYTLVAQQQEEKMRQKLTTDSENRQLLLRRILEKKKIIK